MTCGGMQCPYTKSMGKTPTNCQVNYNRKWFYLMFDRVQKKTKTMMKNLPWYNSMHCEYMLN